MNRWEHLTDAEVKELFRSLQACNAFFVGYSGADEPATRSLRGEIGDELDRRRAAVSA